MNVGENIKKYRKQRGYTQQNLAIRTGLSLRILQKYESGEVAPKTTVVEDLALGLGVSVNDLIITRDEGITTMAIEDHIRMAIEAETERASSKKGKFFIDHHQAVNVLREELEEANDEMENLKHLQEELWGACKRDEDPSELLDEMKETVRKLLVEAVQVAAMIEKYALTNELMNQSKEEKK